MYLKSPKIRGVKGNVACRCPKGNHLMEIAIVTFAHHHIDTMFSYLID